MAFLRRHADWAACALLILITLAYAALFVDFKVPPFEDAAMLMRYADHLAHGAGIVWNIGEHPVDGATDFLFMASLRGADQDRHADRALGACHRICIAPDSRSCWSTWSIARSGMRAWSSHFSTALYLAVGTGLSYVAAFFGTPFFALFATVTWAFGLLIIQRENAARVGSVGVCLPRAHYRAYPSGRRDPGCIDAGWRSSC